MDSKLIREKLLTAHGYATSFYLIDVNVSDPKMELEAVKQTGAMLTKLLRETLLLIPKE